MQASRPAGAQHLGAEGEARRHGCMLPAVHWRARTPGTGGGGQKTAGTETGRGQGN